MTLKRLLTVGAVFAFLVLAVPALAADTGGGVSAPSEPAPSVEAAQEETPTTPEGEKQPPEEQPNGEQPPSEPTEPVDEVPEDIAGPEAGDEAAGGELPRTGSGIEFAALTSIGLGLLLAGAALWPTSSWPPPRDRLSRSTPRR
jgi:hypothetical protein